MTVAHLLVNVVLAVALCGSAAADFVRYERILVGMANAGVPESWLTGLGLVKVAGALGLLVGLWVPVLGIAASVGVVLFFVAALFVHLRARDYALGPVAAFGLLAAAALALGLA